MIQIEDFKAKRIEKRDAGMIIMYEYTAYDPTNDAYFCITIFREQSLN